MIVRESISFERGRDPKSSMGIGIKDPELLADHVIGNLPDILNVEKIPWDILQSDTYVIKQKYLRRIEKWVAKLFGLYADNHGNFWASREDYKADKKWKGLDSILGFDNISFYNILARKLENLGFHS